MPRLTAIGQKVEERRKDLVPRVTQQQLADAAGVTRQHFGRVLVGDADLKLGQWQKVAERLGVDLGELTGDAPASRGTADQLTGTGPADVRAELPPDVAKAARRLVDAFKREAAIAGASPEELHYVETVLMTPNLPPTLAGGAVPPEQLLEHIQAMMEPLRVLLRKLGRKI